MALDITVTGFEKVSSKLQKLSAGLISKTEEALTEVIVNVHSDAVKSIQERTPGETQVRYGAKGVRGTSKRTVIASKPGDPPNTDTGRGASSIDFDITRRRKEISGRVGTGERYMLYLEFGTRDMEARPWLRPALKKHIKSARLIFINSAKEIIKRTKL